MTRSSSPNYQITTRQYLWQLLRYKPWVWLLTVLAYMLLYGLNFAPPLIARAIFDQLTGDAPATFGLWTFILLLLGSSIGQQAAYVALIAGQVLYFNLIGAVVRTNLFERILNRPAAQALTDSPGEVVSRFRDDIQPITTFLGSAFNLVGVSVFAILAIVTMARTSALLTVVAFLPLVLISIAINQSRRRIMRFREANQAATSSVTGLLGELFGAVQAIKVADAERAVISRLGTINEQRRQAALKDRLVTELFGVLGSNLGDVGTAIILLLMGQAMRGGSFTVGDFAFFIYVMPFIAGNMGSVAGVLTSYRQLGVSVQRLAALLQDVPSTALVQHRPVYFWGQPPSQPVTPSTPADPFELLTLSDLTYHYPGSGKGITHISFQLYPHTLTVITGQIGAGKSTLLRVILGLLQHDHGEIRWNGEIVEDAGAFFQPPRSAYTPQAPRLFSDSLRENILMGLTANGGAPLLDNAIHAAVLEEDLVQLENGVETVVGPRGVRLSGGQIQRTAAARMFARHPQLLVFDDLSSALDIETEEQLWQRLFPTRDAVQANVQDNGLRQTYLVVSHRQTVLQRANQILVLKEGSLDGIGTFDELMATNEEMQILMDKDR